MWNHNSTFLEAQPKSSSKSILHGWDHIRKGITWKTGSGEQVRIGRIIGYLTRLLSVICPPLILMLVNQAILYTIKETRLATPHIFTPNSKHILSIPLPQFPKPDQPLWVYAIYSVKSG